MSAKFTLEGSAAGAVNAVGEVDKKLGSAEKSAEKLTAASKRVEESLQRQAQRIKELVDPQERYNRKVQELDGHLRSQRLTQEQVTAATAKYRAEQDAAAGPGPAARIMMMAASYLSVQQAISLGTQALRENAAEREKAAQQAIRSRAGLGSLSQLAANEGNTPAERRAANARLIAEARGMVAKGAAVDENEAGALLFQLAGAGLNERDRGFAANIRAAGTLTNVGGAAEAYSALKTSLGESEVGTFREFMSKSLKAAGPAPGSFEQLPIAAAQSGGSAKALGVSDEFLLAATTILGKSSGSIEEGGTQLAAFLRQTEKSGMRGIEGVGGMALIDRIASLPESKQGLGGVLGDRSEAVQAFRTLRDNRAELQALMAGVSAAQGSDLAGEAAGLPDTDKQLRAAGVRVRAEGEAQVARTMGLSERENLIKALRAERRGALAADGSGGGARSIVENVEDFFGSDAEIRRSQFQLDQSRASGLTSPFSEKTTRLLEDYGKRTAEAAERTEQQTRSKVATRPE